MTEPTIKCPKCQHEIKLTETLTAPLIEAEKQRYREYHERELARVQADVQAREAAVREQQLELAQSQRALDDQIEARLVEERKKISEDESRKARLVLQSDLQTRSDEIKNLKEALQERELKLGEAQKAQAELIRKQRELDDARREMDLTIETRVQDALGEVREKAKREAEEGLQLKVREKELQISQMQSTIEDLRKKSEQGSQQLQGEVFELELEELLKREFPFDSIEPVGKGETGADLIQRVHSPGGSEAGSILWEVKRTRNWSEGWLGKLRTDQRAANADLALIVSHALPKGVSSFELRDDVWVTGPQCALPVAVALRQMLLSASAARRVAEGQLTKQELIYEYLTGPRFRHRVGAIVEQFNDMRNDLERERKALTKQWAKREQQIRCVLDSTAGMIGDLQGMAGQSIQEVEGLSVDLIAGPLEDE